MKCTFIGVGSAFDADQTNTSILLESGSSSMLLDCGFNAAHSYVRHAQKSSDLDLLWISHFHGDHFFGVPFLIGYFLSSGRTKNFTILGPTGIEEKVTAAVKLAYSNIFDKIQFDINFVDVEPGAIIHNSGFKVSACYVDHTQPAMAVRVESGGSAMFYSGDGGMTSECEMLANRVDLGVMEAYQLIDKVKGHYTVRECLDFATLVEMRNVALVHVDPFVRTCKKEETLKLLHKKASIEAFLPEEGHIFRSGMRSNSSYAISED